MKIIFMSLLILNICYGQNAIRLHEGDTSPFTGVLLKDNKLKELEKAHREVEALERISKTQEDLIDYETNRANFYKKEVTVVERRTFFTNTGYFLLGIVLTSIAYKAAYETRR